MRVLVTGAAGFIGSHTVDCLLKKNISVVGIDNLTTGHIENLETALSHPDFTFLEMDLTSGKDSIISVLNEYNPDVVLHLAALVSVTDSVAHPDENFRLNIQMTHDLLEACRHQKVSRFVYASSAAVYGNCKDLPISETYVTNPISPYGAAKMFGENMLNAYNGSFGIEWIAFRYFNVYGPRQNPGSPYSGVISKFVDNFAKKNPLTIYGSGEQSRDFIYVSDVAKFNTEACINRNVSSGVYNICTGEESSINQLITILEKRFNTRVHPMYKDARTGDIFRSFGTNQKLCEEFSMATDFSLEGGLGHWLAE